MNSKLWLTVLVLNFGCSIAPKNMFERQPQQTTTDNIEAQSDQVISVEENMYLKKAFQSPPESIEDLRYYESVYNKCKNNEYSAEMDYSCKLYLRTSLEEFLWSRFKGGAEKCRFGFIRELTQPSLMHNKSHIIEKNDKYYKVVDERSVEFKRIWTYVAKNIKTNEIIYRSKPYVLTITDTQNVASGETKQMLIDRLTKKASDSEGIELNAEFMQNMSGLGKKIALGSAKDLLQLIYSGQCSK